MATASFDQLPNDIAPDGAGGVYIAWTGDGDVYVQRLDALGNPAIGWPANGLNLSPIPELQINSRVVVNGNQGCVVAWQDLRNAANAYDIYAQRVTAGGTLAAGWANNGIAVCNAHGDQRAPVLASDGAGGALVAWQDFRVDGDVYAQRVRLNGATGDTLPITSVEPAASPAFAIVGAFPNPSRSTALRISLALPNAAPARLSLIDAQGRLITQEAVRLACGGRASVTLDAARGLAPGVYLLRLDQSGHTTSRSVSIVK